MRDSFELLGAFHARVYRRDRLVDVIDERNLLLNSARTALLDSFNGAPTDLTVTHIGFGSSGTAAAVADAALTTEYRRAVLSIARSGAPAFTVTWQLDELEANGLNVREFGLFTAGGVLLARKARGIAIAKTSDVRLEGTWTLSFA